MRTSRFKTKGKQKVIGRTADVGEVTARVVSIKHFNLEHRRLALPSKTRTEARKSRTGVLWDERSEGRKKIDIKVGCELLRATPSWLYYVGSFRGCDKNYR